MKENRKQRRNKRNKKGLCEEKKKRAKELNKRTRQRNVCKADVKEGEEAGMLI